MAKCTHGGEHRFDVLFCHSQYNQQICTKETKKKHQMSQNIEELCDFGQHRKKEAQVSIKALTAPCQDDRSCSLKNYF